MEFAIYLCGVLWTLIEGHFCYRMICAFMEPRKNKVIRLFAWFCYSMIVSVIIYPCDTINITYTLFFFLAVNWMAFRGEWLKRISIVMMFYPIIIAINYMAGETAGIVIQNFHVTDRTVNSFISTAVFLIPVLFWNIFYRKSRKFLLDLKGVLDTKSWILLDIICLASMAAVFSSVYYTPKESYKMFPGMIACMITNIGSIFLAGYLAASIRKDMERRNLRLQEKYYQELEKNQLELRRFRHDMKNHFAVVGDLLGQGEITKAKSYFDELSGRLDGKNHRFCKNGIINALLNVKYNVALEKEIDCFFHIGIDEMIGMKDMDVCTIFANTIDNAIEALRDVPPEKRKLSVKARYAPNGYFTYEIVNAKVNKIIEKKGAFLTGKEDQKSYGFGIASVRETVEKYNGMLDISYTEEEFRVVILIRV